MNNCRGIFWCGFLLASSALAQTQPKEVNLKDVPRPVQRAMQLWLAGGTLDRIDEVQEKGRATFEIDFTNKDGKDRDFSLASNGTLLSLEISLAEAPTPVQRTIKSEASADKLDSIEKNLDGDDPTYDIILITKEDTDRDFTLDQDGKVISRQVTLTEAPDAVQRAIKAQAGANAINDIEKVYDEDNTVSFQVDVAAQNGASKSFSVNGGDGRLESVEIDLVEAPASVQKTIADEIGAGQFESLDKVFDSDSIIYEASYYAKAGRERRFTIGADGKLNSREVALADAPPPVQATIKQQLGAGKVLRIDHSFIAKDAGVFPFEVQAEKNGQPFDFSVGPKGRFLGMDD